LRPATDAPRPLASVRLRALGTSEPSDSPCDAAPGLYNEPVINQVAPLSGVLASTGKQIKGWSKARAVPARTRHVPSASGPWKG